MPVATAVYPVVNRWVGCANETTPGTPVLPTSTIPMTSFAPEDKVEYLMDSGWRNAMGDDFGAIQGTYAADLSCGGAFFGDTTPTMFVNGLGDYSVAMSNPGTASTPAAAYAAGTTTISVTSGTLTVGQPYLFYLTGTSGFAEVVTPISGTGVGPYTLKQKLYYAHTSGAASLIASTPATSMYTHTFTQLNTGLGAGGWTSTQPRTNTLTDWTGLPATYGARCYAYACLSELSITGNSTALLMWEGKFSAFRSTIAASAPTAAPSTVAAQPSWNAPTLTIGGTQTNNIAEWKLSLTRELAPKWTNQGSQNPYVIPRGALKAALSLNFDPAIDESPLLAYLNNTQPAIAITQSNGASGLAAVTLTVSAQVAAYDKATVSEKTVFGYDTTQKLIQSTTGVGPSGGYTPVSIAVTNNVPTY